MGPPGADGRPAFGFKAGQAPREVDWEGQRRQIDAAFERGVQHVRAGQCRGIRDRNMDVGTMQRQETQSSGSSAKPIKAGCYVKSKCCDVECIGQRGT